MYTNYNDCQLVIHLHPPKKYTENTYIAQIN